MRIVHDLGPLYCWGGRYETEMQRSVQRGMVRNIEPPYRRGKGLEIQLGEFVIGFGLMNVRMKKTNDEELGLARVLGSVPIDATGEEIGEWDGTAQEVEASSQPSSPA